MSDIYEEQNNKDLEIKRLKEQINSQDYKIQDLEHEIVFKDSLIDDTQVRLKTTKYLWPRCFWLQYYPLSPQ